MNIMSLFLRLYGWMDTLSDDLSDMDRKNEAENFCRELRGVMASEGLKAVYSDSQGCYVLIPVES